MTMLEDKKDAGLWVAKIVATTIICALMYKGMGVLTHEESQTNLNKSSNHSLYMNFTGK